MISYCPLDEDYDRVPLPPAPRRVPRPEPGLLDGEDTECNYLVLFFILGVLILAASDSLRK